MQPETTTGKTIGKGDLRGMVREAVERVSIVDMHTHLFAPQFGELNLWGIDELLTYHYLIAELFRSSDITPAAFWRLSRREQADRVWEALFVQNTPLSESAHGVVTILDSLGIDPRSAGLDEVRRFFENQKPESYLDTVLKLCGVESLVMTNDPFDAAEAEVWESGAALDPRFHAALRIDPILSAWDRAWERLAGWGFEVTRRPDTRTFSEVRRFLEGWVRRLKPLYLAVSLEADFRYPDASAASRLLREAILPVCRTHGLPFALMIGVRRQVNPALRLAGDGVNRADLGPLMALCEEFPEQRFLVTMLSRENQHELCVAARKFSNLMIFGCWWFVNNPSIVAEITRERLELLGFSFIPQHSDARVLDQLVYKWKHARRLMAEILADYYESLAGDGWPATAEEIERDVARLFRNNFKNWVGIP